MAARQSLQPLGVQIRIRTVGRLSCHLWLLVTCLFQIQAQQTNNVELDRVVKQSDCVDYKWKQRGRAPSGYIKGMAMLYGKAYAEHLSSAGPFVRAMIQPLMKEEDVLVRYRPNMERDGVDPNNPSDRLRALFTIAIGQGMRESSGNTTEGRDMSVRKPTAAGAEAGLFQQSFDSFRRSPLFIPLLEKYEKNDRECLLSVFLEGLPRRIERPVYGTGKPAAFQSLTRACPAFATEYALILFRLNMKHFGPLKRQEAEYHTGCSAMLRKIELIAK